LDLKILVIRFSSIGDILLTTPVLRCLKQQIPEAEIHYATKLEYSVLVERNPHVAKVHVLDLSFPDLIRSLRAEQFDLVVDLHASLRSRRVCFLVGKKVLRFSKKNLLKWLIVNFKLRKSVPHVVDRYMAAVAPLGVAYDGRGLDFPVTDEEREFTASLFPESWQSGFAAVTVGARHATKALPSEKMTEVLNTLGLPVALLGGPGESSLASALLSRLRVPAVNLCGRLSLGMSGAILEKSVGVLAHDTGLMHMAAALRKPMVVVWGSTVPALGMAPLYPQDMGNIVAYAEVSDLRCRPCHKIGRRKCPRGHFRCMMDQDAREIRRLFLEKTKLSIL
jgi:ADP-heptose:LPS heptosyltransferase